MQSGQNDFEYLANRDEVIKKEKDDFKKQLDKILGTQTAQKSHKHSNSSTFSARKSHITKKHMQNKPSLVPSQVSPEDELNIIGRFENNFFDRASEVDKLSEIGPAHRKKFQNAV